MPNFGQVLIEQTTRAWHFIMMDLNIIIPAIMKTRKTYPVMRGAGVWVLFSLAYIFTSGHFLLHAEGWTRSREIGTFVKGEVPVESFTLNVWGGDGVHVHGLCGYYNAKATPVEISGRETSAGEFYPDVIYEVSNGDGSWETLEAPILNVGERITAIIEAGKRSRPFNVNLDVFVPLMGKMKYGRVVLQTAEGTVFRIDELQPEKK